VALPTIARRPAAQQERKRRQARQLRAAELFAIGVRQAEVARQLGVSSQAVSVWYARFKAGGTDALRSRGPTGPTPSVSDAQLGQVEQALLEGATANGFVGELWTLDRVAIVIERLTGVRHHPAHVWALLRHRLGWSVQLPAHRASKRDQDAIDCWVAQDWPRIKQKRRSAQSLSGLLRRERAQPDAQRPPHLGAARPAAGASPSVQLEARVDGGCVVLRRARWRRPALLPRLGGQLRHRQSDRGPE
jgi:transposase